MHRSGTSTLTQVLWRLGLHLGDGEDLFTANEYNVDGYFEHRNFVALNNRILERLGGGWDLPLGLEPGWHEREDIVALVPEAEKLVESLAGDGILWGWKDPRTCLTMPFWLSLLPETRVVASLRNPLEVAASLRRRGAASVPFGLALWRTYNRSLLENVPAERLVFTHYEAYFGRPQEEFRRVADFAGIDTSEQMISLVRSRVIRGLRNHVYTDSDLREADPSGETLALYTELCERAGWPTGVTNGT